MRQIDMWLDGFKLDIKKACALHLRARAEHMHNTNAHTTVQLPYGNAGARSAKLYNYINIYMCV